MVEDIIETGVCNDSYKTELAENNRYTFYCPAPNSTITVGGNEFLRENLYFVSLNVYKCNGVASNGKKCEDE